jgi:hypothetical protein
VTRCGAPTIGGEPCQQYPLEGGEHCRHHETIDGGAGDEVERCGAPTNSGRPCRRHVTNVDGERCHLHSGLVDTTEAEAEASREAAVTHGYFVSGFLDEEEKELFREVLRGRADIGELKENVIAALVVRANRTLKWESKGQEVSGFATEVFEELRKALESIEPDELTIEHAWDEQQVVGQVEQLLREDDELLLRVVPEQARPAVEEALAG